MKKRILATLLVLCMMLAMLPGTALAANQSGKCGKNLTWTLDGAGTLTIKGSGMMFDYTVSYNQDDRPWKDSINNVKKVVIQKGATSIGGYAFANLRNLISVTIPTGVTVIGDGAFSGCESLTSVTIPSGVTSIGDYAFYGCESLTSVTIPSGVTAIGGSAFFGCKSLTSVAIPSSVTSIGSCVFYGCKSLTSVTIPSGVTSIECSAFEGCSSLTSVTIPSGVTSIWISAFSGCESLTKVTIPSSVTSIESWAFSGCSSLTSVTIPSSVTSIGPDVFSGCSSLTRVSIPVSVSYIDSNAFYSCNELTDIYYAGTKEQWEAIRIDNSGNIPLLTADIRYNSSLPTDQTKTYTLTFNANGGVCATKTKKLNANASYGTLPTATRSGYTFAGWYTGKTSGSKVTEDTVAKASRTLYARWNRIRTYMVTFDPNGGEVMQDAKLAVVGSAYKDLPTPTRNGWHFSGWYTAKTGGVKVTEKTRVKLTEDQTLYARWTKTAPKVQKTETGRWTVSIPAYYALPLYSSNTTASRAATQPEKSDFYTVVCTKRVTLSNGTVRYYGTVGGKARWFVYTCEMDLD